MEVPQTNVLFRLRRYNGKHWHRNKLEGERFRGFHIHTATKRYQERGFDEDKFAQRTDRYSGFGSALRCMIEDCGFYGSETPLPPVRCFAMSTASDDIATDFKRTVGAEIELLAEGTGRHVVSTPFPSTTATNSPYCSNATAAAGS